MPHPSSPRSPSRSSPSPPRTARADHVYGQPHLVRRTQRRHDRAHLADGSRHGVSAERRIPGAAGHRSGAGWAGLVHRGRHRGWRQRAIGRITTSGSLTEYVLPTPAGASSGAGGIAVGSDGNFWFTWATQASPDLASVSRSIGRITPAGAITEFPVSSGHGWPPGGIAAWPDGNLWFTTGAVNTVGSISTSGTIEQFPVPTANSFPTDVVAGPDGNVWFSEATSSKIGRVNRVGIGRPRAGIGRPRAEDHVRDRPTPLREGTRDRHRSCERVLAGRLGHDPTACGG